MRQPGILFTCDSTGETAFIPWEPEMRGVEDASIIPDGWVKAIISAPPGSVRERHFVNDAAAEEFFRVRKERVEEGEEEKEGVSR